MRRLRDWIRKTFHFSTTEANQFLILLPLLTMLLFSRSIYHHFFLRAPQEPTQDTSLDQLALRLSRSETMAGRRYQPAWQKPTWFHFNPNSISDTEWERLGLPPYLAQRIIRYREKGGRFRKPNDLLRIYGMDSAWYALALAYIHIPPDEQKQRMGYPRPATPSVEARRATPSSLGQASAPPFNLNEADTTRLRGLRGIGPVLARRIVAYREALGGFVRSEQLLEVYGLSPETAAMLADESFIPSDFIPRQLDINAPASVLARHPYIGRRRADLLTAYRFQHGRFASMADWGKVETIDSAFLTRIFPYLKTTP